MKRVRKVVIPAAGLGTRGLPFSKELPKEMVPIIDTPALHFIVEEAAAAGIEQVIFVTSKGKSAMEDYFDPSPQLEAVLRSRGKTELADQIHSIGTMVDVLSVRQKEPLGLGHAVLCAEPLVGDEPFAVCLGDEIFPRWPGDPRGPRSLQLLADHAVAHEASVIGVLPVPREQTRRYGIVDLGGAELGEGATPVVGTVEKPEPQHAPSQLAIIGRYVFQPEIFSELRKVKPGVGGEIQLTDALDALAQRGRLRAMEVKDHRYDVGNALYYVLAQVDAALHRPELAQPLRELLKGRLG